jgi:uncharacterized membrane protein
MLPETTASSESASGWEASLMPGTWYVVAGVVGVVCLLVAFVVGRSGHGRAETWILGVSGTGLLIAAIVQTLGSA